MQVVAALPTAFSELNWGTGELVGILSDSLKKVRDIAQGDKAYFFTDRPDLLTRAASFGLTPCTLAAVPDACESKSLLPLLAANLSPKFPALFLDLRNPSFSLDQACQALSMYKAHNSPVIRLRPPADHPFFLYSATRTKSCGLLHLLDHHLKTGKETIITRPFFHDWRKTDISDPDLTDMPYLVKESQMTARAVFPAVTAKDKNSILIGSSIPSNADPEIMLLQGQDGTIRPVLSLPGRFSAEFIPFDQKGLLPSHRFSRNLCFDEPLTAGQIFENNVDQKYSGWLYFLEETVEEGQIGEAIAFSPSEPCWTGVTNTSTGQRITGRQQLPEVWEPDYSFILSAPDQIFRLGSLFERGALCGLKVAGKQVFLQTPIDLLTLRAIQRVKKEWKAA